MKFLKNLIKENYEKHKKLYISLFFVYILGFVLGLVVMLGLSMDKKEELGDYILGFINLYEKQSIEPISAFWSLLWTNVRYLLVGWVLGASVVGIPFLFGILGIKGFCAGFTSSVFVWVSGSQGALFDAVALVPGELLSAPIMVFSCVTSVVFSLSIIRKKKEEFNLKKGFLEYCGKLLLALVLLAAVSMLQAWIISLSVKLFLN